MNLSLKTPLTGSLHLLLLLSLIFSHYTFNHAQRFHREYSDPMASTEMEQYFESPTSARYALENVPRKNLTFIVLLTSVERDNKNDCVMANVLAVLELAIRHVLRLKFAHNAQIGINLVSRDTNCSSTYGPIGFFELSMKWPEINAVMGLSCEYVLAPISRYAGVWKIPVLTSGGSAKDFNNKANSYPTLTRLRGSLANNLGNAIQGILDSFNWTTTVLIYQNEDTKTKGNSVCFFCAVVVHDQVRSVYQQAMDTERWNKTSIVRLVTTISKKANSKYIMLKYYLCIYRVFLKMQ